MRKYPTRDEVLAIHKILIEEFGGESGLLDRGGLESALGRINSGYYSTIHEEAAALMESLSQNHPFVDGNKRVSFFVTDVFLRMNGYHINCDNEMASSFFQSLFESQSFDFDHLLVWLKEHVQSLGGEFPANKRL